MVKKKERTVLKYPIPIFLENFRTSMENKYTVLPRYTATFWTREIFGGKRKWRCNERTQLCMDT